MEGIFRIVYKTITRMTKSNSLNGEIVRCNILCKEIILVDVKEKKPETTIVNEDKKFKMLIEYKQIGILNLKKIDNLNKKNFFIYYKKQFIDCIKKTNLLKENEKNSIFFSLNV